MRDALFATTTLIGWAVVMVAGAYYGVEFFTTVGFIGIATVGVYMISTGRAIREERRPPRMGPR